MLYGGETPAIDNTSSFADVDKDAWYAPYVALCHDRGFIHGIGNDRFAPGGDVTIEQAAKILLTAIGGDKGFTGADWAKAVNSAAQEKGLYHHFGCGDTREPLTRDNAAQMIANAMQSADWLYGCYAQKAPVVEPVVEPTNYCLTDYFDMTLNELTSILGSDYQCIEWDGQWRLSYDDSGYFTFEKKSDSITGSETIEYIMYGVGDNPEITQITPTISAPLYYSDLVDAGIASGFDYVDTSGDSMYAGLIEYVDNNGYTIQFGWGAESNPYSDPVNCVEIFRNDITP